MKQSVIIKDHKGSPTKIELTLKTVKAISLLVVSGDMVLHIIRKNKKEEFDSSEQRLLSFLDREVIIVDRFEEALDIITNSSGSWEATEDLRKAGFSVFD